MKRKIIGLLVCAIVFICCIGCSNESDSDEDSATYKVEVGVVSNATYTTAMNTIAYWSEVSYANIASLRLYLYNNTISDHEPSRIFWCKFFFLCLIYYTIKRLFYQLFFLSFQF